MIYHFVRSLGGGLTCWYMLSISVPMRCMELLEKKRSGFIQRACSSPLDLQKEELSG